MYKVLLVDDEPNVRQGIKMMIPWDEIDCEVISEANDGDEGLSAIMDLSPDIVIADIKMPGKTGIEMTQAARSLGFIGKVIILSGYSDFTYAKEAISLGVESFILKPVDEDELIEAIKSAEEKIRSERESSIHQQMAKEYLDERLVRGLLSGSEEAVRTAGSYGYSGYMAAVITAFGDEEVYDRVRSFLSNLRNVDFVTVDISGVMGVLFKSWDREEIRDVLDRLGNTLGRSVFISCGDCVISPSDICMSYSGAVKLYRCRFVYRHLIVAWQEDISDTERTDEDFSEKIFAYMQINDTVKVRKALDAFALSMQTEGMTPEKAKVNCITMIMDVRAKLEQSSADRKGDVSITEEFIERAGEANSLYDVISDVKDMFCSISDASFGKSTRSTMEKIVRYIRDNYNHELRLESLAEIFGYNSAYLGKVFHQHTGENFNNYLDDIRIKEAKRLLSEEDYKVFEVAEMVGYSNINYFHNKFKKYVGMSPLSFKKLHNKGAEE